MKRPPIRRSNSDRAYLQDLAIILICCLGFGLDAVPVFSQDNGDPPEILEVTGKKKHRRLQNRPIKLGTSGGNVKDLTARECCDGTLGALVEKNGTQYILSNNHVLARTNKAKKGEAIIQPGLGDQRPICEPLNPAADTVAFLSARKRVKFGAGKNNKVDAAIAEVVPGAVQSNGQIMGIGVPGTNPVEAFVGMKVKKSGRTTGLTKGSVFAVNGTARVEYPKKCGSDSANFAEFDDLIFILGNNDNPFIRGGDSGSMVYENKKNCPRPVGLIFAGGEELAAASPASTVQRVIGRLSPSGPMHFVGCGNTASMTSSTTSMAAANDESRAIPDTSNVSRPVLDEQQIELATRAMRSRKQDLLEVRSVHGFGIGVTLDGTVEPAIYVFASESPEEVKTHLPDAIDGYRVEVFKVGTLIAN